MCAVALVPQLLCSSVAPFLCSCVGDDPTHDLKRHSGPDTTSRSQAGATQAPNTPAHTPRTQSQAAHQTPHHVEITTRVNTSTQHPCPHTPHMISSGTASPTPRRDHNQGVLNCPHPAVMPSSLRAKAQNTIVPTRDVPRHPSNPTSLSSTHANTPHTTQTPGQANPPAPATTQTPGQATPCPCHNTRPHTPALHGRG